MFTIGDFAKYGRVSVGCDAHERRCAPVVPAAEMLGRRDC